MKAELLSLKCHTAGNGRIAISTSRKVRCFFLVHISSEYLSISCLHVLIHMALPNLKLTALPPRLSGLDNSILSYVQGHSTCLLASSVGLESKLSALKAMHCQL